jgi:hypothetical protein
VVRDKVPQSPTTLREPLLVREAAPNANYCVM